MSNSKNVFVNNIYYHILNSKARVIINYGGRDSGKSYFIGGQLIPLAMLQEKGFRGVGIRKTYSSIKDSVFQEIEDGIDNFEQDYKFHSIKNPLEITCTSNNNKMIFRGLDDARKIKSLKGINFIWVEEAEDLTETQFDDLLILLRGDGYQRLILTYNPIDEDHFTNERFVKYPNKKIIEIFDNGEPKVWEIKVEEVIDNELVTYDVLCICSTYQDNEFIEPVRKLVIEKMKETNPFLYEVYRYGKFASRGGRILTNIEQRDFKVEGVFFYNFDRKGYAQDFGLTKKIAQIKFSELVNTRCA